MDYILLLRLLKQPLDDKFINPEAVKHSTKYLAQEISTCIKNLINHFLEQEETFLTKFET